MFQISDHTSIKSSRKKTLNVLIKNFEKKLEVINWDGLKFPVNLSDIKKFENHNSSISVNVFGYEKAVYPLRISKHNYKFINFKRYKTTLLLDQRYK